jgi:hypothetical protein
LVVADPDDARLLELFNRVLASRGRPPLNGDHFAAIDRAYAAGYAAGIAEASPRVRQARPLSVTARLMGVA